MFERKLPAAGALLGTLLLLSGATASAQNLLRGSVFTATNEAAGNEVVAYARDAAGQLTELASYSTGGLGTGAGLGNQGGLTLDRSGRLLLVVNAGDDTLSSFRVAPGGLELADVVASGGEQPISVTVRGHLAYVLNAGGDGSVCGFSLAPDGSLALIAGSTRPLSAAGTGPAQVGFSPDGSFLAVTEKATSTIVTYAVDRGGLAGDPVVSPSEGMTPFGFSFDNHGHLLVSEAAGGAAGQSSASSYAIQADGTLAPITSALATTQSAACWLVTTGNGRHAYVTNTGSATVTGLEVEASGALALLEPDGLTASSGTGPIDAALTRDSRFLYVLNGGDGTVGAYSVGADGSLTELGTVGGLPAGTNGLAAL